MRNYCEATLSTFIIKLSLTFNYVARNEETRNGYKISMEKPEAKR
jgi:hypothetical protein